MSRVLNSESRYFQRDGWQSLHRKSLSNVVIESLHPKSSSSKGAIEGLLIESLNRKSSSKYFIQSLHRKSPSKVSNVDCLHQTSSSKIFIKSLHRKSSSKVFIKCLHQFSRPVFIIIEKAGAGFADKTKRRVTVSQK